VLIKSLFLNVFFMFLVRCNYLTYFYSKCWLVLMFPLNICIIEYYGFVVLKVLALRRPFLHKVLDHEDEFFSLLMLVLETHSLRTTGLISSFYGLAVSLIIPFAFFYINKFNCILTLTLAYVVAIVTTK